MGDNDFTSELSPNGTELGELIGKVKKSFKITNDFDEEVNMTVTFDYSTMPNARLIGRLVAKTVIDFQNGGKRRSLSRKGLEELDGITVLAKEAGKKVPTREEQKKQYVANFTANGMSKASAEALADKLVDNPAALDSVL